MNLSTIRHIIAGLSSSHRFVHSRLDAKKPQGRSQCWPRPGWYRSTDRITQRADL